MCLKAVYALCVHGLGIYAGYTIYKLLRLFLKYTFKEEVMQMYIFFPPLPLFPSLSSPHSLSSCREFVSKGLS